jgi:hypothetical protein
VFGVRGFAPAPGSRPTLSLVPSVLTRRLEVVPPFRRVHQHAQPRHHLRVQRAPFQAAEQGFEVLARLRELEARRGARARRRGVGRPRGQFRPRVGQPAAHGDGDAVLGGGGAVGRAARGEGRGGGGERRGGRRGGRRGAVGLAAPAAARRRHGRVPRPPRPVLPLQGEEQVRLLPARALVGAVRRERGGRGGEPGGAVGVGLAEQGGGFAEQAQAALDFQRGERGGGGLRTRRGGGGCRGEGRAPAPAAPAARSAAHLGRRRRRARRRLARLGPLGGRRRREGRGRLLLLFLFLLLLPRPLGRRRRVQLGPRRVLVAGRRALGLARSERGGELVHWTGRRAPAVARGVPALARREARAVDLWGARRRSPALTPRRRDAAEPAPAAAGHRGGRVLPGLAREPGERRGSRRDAIGRRVGTRVEPSPSSLLSPSSRPARALPPSSPHAPRQTPPWP